MRFELALLAELGFGLDLTRCAATGSREDLVYVSPRSGGAVSAAAGAAYRDRLLALPGFLTGESDPAPADIAAGFALTEFFLRRHVFEPRGEDLPEERRRLAAAATAADLPARF